MHTASTYKFRDGVSKTTERNNKALYEELSHDGTYHHKVRTLDFSYTAAGRCPFMMHPRIQILPPTRRRVSFNTHTYQRRSAWLSLARRQWGWASCSLRRLIPSAQRQSPLSSLWYVNFSPCSDVHALTQITIPFQVRFHIEEWKEGKHIRGQFKETDYGQVYTGLLKDINAWASSNETAWKNIRSKWYKRA